MDRASDEKMRLNLYMCCRVGPLLVITNWLEVQNQNTITQFSNPLRASDQIARIEINFYSATPHNQQINELKSSSKQESRDVN